MSELPNQPQMTVQDALRLAVNHLTAGQPAQAEAICRQVLIRQPEHPVALQLLATIAQQVGKFSHAHELVVKALRSAPNAPELHLTLGNILKDLDRLEESAGAFQTAIQLRPQMAEAYGNLGLILLRLKRAGDAIEAFRSAIRYKPELPNPYLNLADALRENEQFEESAKTYETFLSLRPDHPQALNNYGNVLQSLGQYDKAIIAYRRAIQLNPKYAEAYNNLGTALHLSGAGLDEVIDAYQKSSQLNPRLPEALINLGMAYKESGDLNKALGCWQRARPLNPTAGKLADDNYVYYLHFHPDYDAGAIRRELDRWAADHATPLRNLLRHHTNDSDPDRRLRIGYVSPDFRTHAVAFFLLPLLENRNRSEFEVHCYSSVARADTMTQRIKQSADVWHDVRRLSNAQLAEQIRADRIDILVDLTMHMGNNRLLVFAQKPAPVQVTWLAYASTTGLTTMDYRITDPFLDPPDAPVAELYSERSVRLPRTYWCYSPPSQAPEVNQLPALTQTHVTFGSMNMPWKITDQTLELWRRVLEAVPDAHLIVHMTPGSHRSHLLEKLVAGTGVDPRRVEFVGKRPIEQYFESYHKIDIVLDTYPYGGGTTTCDALWMGVSVVTLAGKTAIHRSGVSLLNNVGLPNLVAESADQFVKIATDLAKDLPRLAELRCGLRQKMQSSPLMDAPQFTHDMEAAFKQMWRDYCAAVTLR